MANHVLDAQSGFLVIKITSFLVFSRRGRMTAEGGHSVSVT